MLSLCYHYVIVLNYQHFIKRLNSNYTLAVLKRLMSGNLPVKKCTKSDLFNGGWWKDIFKTFE